MTSKNRASSAQLLFIGITINTKSVQNWESEKGESTTKLMEKYSYKTNERYKPAKEYEKVDD